MTDKERKPRCVCGKSEGLHPFGLCTGDGGPPEGEIGGMFCSIECFAYAATVLYEAIGHKAKYDRAEFDTSPTDEEIEE